MVPELNFTPAMVVALNTLHMSAVVRVTLSPVLHDAPFVGSVSFCFLDMPYLDFDLRSAAAGAHEQGLSHRGQPSLRRTDIGSCASRCFAKCPFYPSLDRLSD